MTQLKRISLAIVALNVFVICGLFAQQYNVPLTMEGLNHTVNASVMSKAMGGVTIPIQQDVALMFANPAGLSTLSGLTVSLSGSQISTTADHSQQWYPLVYYGNFSLLMDGTVRGIDTSGRPHTPPSSPARYPGDTLQYPYDNLGPNWNHSRSASLLPQVFIAMPLKIGSRSASVGLGLTQYANMDYYYQNNNSLTPDYDLLTTPQTATADSTRTDWAQSIHRREGTINGYGGAFSMSITDNLSAGLSARYLQGSTDDFDQTVGRGVFWWYGSLYAVRRWGVSSNALVLDSVDYQRTMQGTSDFSGLEYTISAQYRTKNVTIGFSITPPSTIERKFSGSFAAHTGKTIDFQASNHSVDTSFTEKMELPWKGKFGIGFQVTSNVLVAMEYESCPYNTGSFIKNGTTTHPWLDASTFRFGLNWEPGSVLSFRFGYRNQKETFAPKNAAFPDQPVSYNVVSAGAGIHVISNLVLNVAYEFYQMKYEDVWAENYNINNLNSNSISAELTYTLK